MRNMIHESCAASLLVLLGLGIGAPAWARTEDAPPAKPAAAPSDPPAESGDDAPADARGGDRRPRPRPQRTEENIVAQVSRLRESMHKDLALTPAQTTDVDALFEKFVDEVKAKKSEPKPDEVGAADEADIRELREQIKAAQKANDQQKAIELRQQVREKMRQRDAARPQRTARLVSELREKLDDQQRPKFDAMVRQLRLEGGPRGRAGEIGRLIRAVNDPKVNLSAGQKDRIQRLVRSSFGTHKAGDGDPRELDAAIEKVRGEVLAELTPEQRKTVDEILAQPDNTGDTKREAREKRRDRDANRSPKGEKQDTPSDDGNDE